MMGVSVSSVMTLSPDSAVVLVAIRVQEVEAVVATEVAASAVKRKSMYFLSFFIIGPQSNFSW